MHDTAQIAQFPPVTTQTFQTTEEYTQNFIFETRPKMTYQGPNIREKLSKGKHLILNKSRLKGLSEPRASHAIIFRLTRPFHDRSFISTEALF